jgi:2-polyprenyl-3-methyl-5-hydroxy-6-metoxy-1,4-benzoquinol methylase
MKSISIDGFNCRICSGETSLIQSEIRNHIKYHVVQCLNCSTIQTVEHIDEVSPDYINLTKDLISHAHIAQSREHKHAAFNQFIKLFKKIISKDTKIVDIGCGTGGFGEYATKIGCSYFGFDASLAQIDYGKSKGLNVERATTCDEYLLKGVIHKDEITIVSMWDVLEHVRNPQNFLEQVKHLMHPKTYLFISIPNGGAFSWKRSINRFMNRELSFDPWEHVFYYNINSLSLLLKECGFEIVESGAVVCYPRKLDLKELARRFLFKILSVFPSVSPQIFIIAKLSEKSV